MSRRIHQAPLALVCDGTVVLNVIEFFNMDAEPSAAELVDVATKVGGRIFVGVQMPPKDRQTALAALQDGFAEVAGRLGAPGDRRLRQQKARGD